MDAEHPSAYLMHTVIGLMTRLHAMVGEEQALVVFQRLDETLGYAAADDHEFSLQMTYNEDTKALVMMIVVSTPQAKLASTAGVIAHLNAVQALVQNNTLRN